MEWYSRLQARDDVNNEDIAEILERAETMRQQLAHSDNAQLNPDDVTRMGEELDIPAELIQQAIDDLRQERQDARSKELASEKNRQQIQRRIWSGLSTAVGWGGGLIVVMVAGVLAMRWIQSLPPPVQEQTIIQKTVIEAPVIQQVESADAEPDSSKEMTPEIMTDAPPMEEVTASDPLPDPASKPVVELAEEAPEVLQDSTLAFPSIDAVIEEAEAVVADVQVLEKATEQEESKSLPMIAKALEGEWILDAYLLYEAGVDLPMEVPVVFEPLEVPTTWRFTNGRYKRVMDKSLSFSASYEVLSLSERLRPTVSGDGQLGQLVASNVVSSIPGIRRQNDYFVVFVSGDSLTIWYLGSNAYRKKLPSQAEHYVRR